MNKTFLTSLPAALLGVAALLAGSGCGSAPPPRDLMAEEAARADSADRPVAMKGEASFADGKLHAVATVARGFTRGHGGKGGKGGSPVRERKGWFRRDTEAFSENYSFDYGDSEEEQKEAIQDYVRQAMARRAAGSPMPPVTLLVAFENTGTEPIEISPTEVNSDLGNFAARPVKLTLAPGEKGALEPMVSQLGVTSDEIPLTLAVRVGSAKPETKIVLVKNVLAPALRK